MSNVCFINTKYNTVNDKIFKEEDEKKILYTICVYFLYTNVLFVTVHIAYR